MLDYAVRVKYSLYWQIETMKDRHRLTYRFFPQNKRVKKMTAILQGKDNVSEQVLYMALELSNKTWKLGFSNGTKIRQKSIPAGDWVELHTQMELAKQKLRLGADCRIVSCYEAGRDGFWIHRDLVAEGITNHVIDSASIEVNRRQRRAKTDRVDVIALLRLLIRYWQGDQQAMSVVRVPTLAEEDQRRLNRERQRLLKERGGHSARIHVTAGGAGYSLRDPCRLS